MFIAIPISLANALQRSAMLPRRAAPMEPLTIDRAGVYKHVAPSGAESQTARGDVSRSFAPVPERP